ncbi:VTT domain-containing protein [Salinisphaera aquimarina]|uniref:VTT domain-containing protein n=1 Tax=Salinisphaera aquimarina TaxID=2094031 RepID=A0ABV7ELY5_9GAMM
MGHSLLEALLAWVSAHPLAALALVFAVAVGESLFIFGLLVPGALFMFAFGALIGANALPLLPTFVAAIIGTLIGDSASYLLGRRYRGRLQALPGFSRAPLLVARGETFLARHGGKAIVLGRLIGALRPIVPTVAGAAGLPPQRFVIMDLIATAVWAPCYILPGVVFGASLDLAAQVATRLAILLLAVVVIVWVTTVAARFVLAAGRVAARRYAEQLMAWSRRHRRLGLLGPALADPRQPEIPALAVSAALLLLVTGVLYLTVWGWQRPVFPMRFDALTFYLVQSLHTPISDAVARVIAEIGSPLIYLPFAGVIAGLLGLMGNRRAAGHWVAALGFSALATLILRAWLAIPAPVAFFYHADMDPLFLAGGGRDLILCATVYGLAGVILASRRPASIRPYYYSVTVAGVMLIALARLYLGLDWASDVLIGLTSAFVWLNMLVLCYNRQHPRPVKGKPVLGVLAGCMMIALLMAVLPENAAQRVPQARHSTSTQRVQGWTRVGYEMLDARIKDIAGRESAPLNLQAAGSAVALQQLLRNAGWQPPPPLTAGQPLRWMVPDTSIRALAVLPRIHDGHRPVITMIHGTADADMRWVLRLWPTDTVTARRSLPLWVGMVDGQTINRRFHLLATAADVRDYGAGVERLRTTLDAAGARYRIVGRAGTARLLFWPPQPGVDAKVAPD